MFKRYAFTIKYIENDMVKIKIKVFPLSIVGLINFFL